MAKILPLHKACGFQLTKTRSNGRSGRTVEICTRTYGGGWLVQVASEEDAPRVRIEQRKLAFKMRDTATHCPPPGTKSAL